MVYDAARKVSVLCGDDANGAFQTWEWDGASWSKRCPAATPCMSPERADFALAYDRSCQRVVLHGGARGITRYGDTWLWNGTSWTQVPTTSGPAALSGAAMCFDEARNVSVLHGGSNCANATCVQDATWTWDCTAWTSRGQGPAARHLHRLSHDTARQRTVLFGGEFASGGCSAWSCAVWEWDGTAWTSATPALAPAWRHAHGQAYDRIRARTVVFGGIGTLPLNDTWEWDGTSWVSVAFTGPIPSARGHVAMCYDEARRCFVLHGGLESATNQWLHDTWEYYAPSAFILFGASCPSSNGFGAIQPPAQLPIVGETFMISARNLPILRPVLGMIGACQTVCGGLALPFCLPGTGFPSCCWLNICPLVTVPLNSNHLGEVQWSVQVPLAPGLIGGCFAQQFAAADPATNQLGIVTTNAGQGVVGTK